MNNFSWLVLENGCAVAGFLSRDDAQQFIDQCGYDAMKRVAARAKHATPVLTQARRLRRKITLPDAGRGKFQERRQ